MGGTPAHDSSWMTTRAMGGHGGDLKAESIDQRSHSLAEEVAWSSKKGEFVLLRPTMPVSHRNFTTSFPNEANAMMFGARNDRKGVRGLPFSRFRFLLPACQMEVQSHTEYRHRQSQARPTSHPTLPHESALVHYCAFGPSVGLGRAMSSTWLHRTRCPEPGGWRRNATGTRAADEFSTSCRRRRELRIIWWHCMGRRVELMFT